ncbi:MAG: hypothetical protein ACFFEE_13835, partial [Candidatus Thorarchaeota archaeon]
MLGIITGRCGRKKAIVLFLSLIFGFVLGLIAGFELAPLQYPFMITEVNWVGIPEIRRVGFALIYPDFVLFQESIHFQSFSLVMMSVLIVISILGSILGILVGLRYRRSDLDSPWEQIE